MEFTEDDIVEISDDLLEKLHNECPECAPWRHCRIWGITEAGSLLVEFPVNGVYPKRKFQTYPWKPDEDRPQPLCWITTDLLHFVTKVNTLPGQR